MKKLPTTPPWFDEESNLDFPPWFDEESNLDFSSEEDQQKSEGQEWQDEEPKDFDWSKLTAKEVGRAWKIACLDDDGDQALNIYMEAGRKLEDDDIVEGALLVVGHQSFNVFTIMTEEFGDHMLLWDAKKRDTDFIGQERLRIWERLSVGSEGKFDVLNFLQNVPCRSVKMREAWLSQARTILSSLLDEELTSRPKFYRRHVAEGAQEVLLLPLWLIASHESYWESAWGVIERFCMMAWSGSMAQSSNLSSFRQHALEMVHEGVLALANYQIDVHQEAELLLEKIIGFSYAKEEKVREQWGHARQKAWKKWAYRAEVHPEIVNALHEEFIHEMWREPQSDDASLEVMWLILGMDHHVLHQQAAKAMTCVVKKELGDQKCSRVLRMMLDRNNVLNRSSLWKVAMNFLHNPGLDPKQTEGLREVLVKTAEVQDVASWYRANKIEDTRCQELVEPESEFWKGQWNQWATRLTIAHQRGIESDLDRARVDIEKMVACLNQVTKVDPHEVQGLMETALRLPPERDKWTLDRHRDSINLQWSWVSVSGKEKAPEPGRRRF